MDGKKKGIIAGIAAVVVAAMAVIWSVMKSEEY